MTSHPAPRRPPLAARQATLVLHTGFALLLVIALLAVAVAVAVAVQVRDDDARIWAPGPFASSPAPDVPV